MNVERTDGPGLVVHAPCPRASASRRGLRLGVLVLAACSFALSFASRSSAQKVVVLPTSAGQGGEAVATLAHNAVRDALGMQGLRVVGWEEAVAKLPASERCDDVAACVPKVLKVASAGLAAGVVVTRNAQGAAERVRVALLDTDKRRYDGEAAVEDGDVRTATTRALLEARSFQLLGPGPWLRVEGTPEGAEVLLDDRIVGRVPYRSTIIPGRHKLRVREAGYTAFEQLLDIPATDDSHVEEVVVALEPAPIAVGTPDGTLLALGGDELLEGERDRMWLVGPIVLGGAGLVLAGITSVRLATGLDGCINPDDRGVCTQSRRVNWAPTVVGYSLSAALVGGAIVWVILGTNSGEQSALAARIGLGELTVSGSF